MTMQVSVADCVTNNNKRIYFSTGKLGYFFCNFIRYKIFLLATYQTILLHCMIYGKTLVVVESWLPWTHVTIKHFSSASFQRKLHNPLLPSRHVTELGAVCHSVFYICWTLSSAVLGHFFSNVSYQSFNHFLTKLQVRQSWKSCWLQVQVAQAFLLTYLLVSADISLNKFALKYSIKIHLENRKLSASTWFITRWELK
jgi:hypothetical protein